MDTDRISIYVTIDDEVSLLKINADVLTLMTKEKLEQLILNDPLNKDNKELCDRIRKELTERERIFKQLDL